MDLNIIVYKNKTFDSKVIIEEKIKRAIDLGFRSIALSVNVESDDILNIPKPPVIKIEELNTTSAKVLIKSRLTVSVDEQIQTHRLNQSINAKKYDLLAIEPINDKMLSYLNNGNFECDIISFDLTERIDLNIRRANFSLPISKGVGIEINYGNALFSQTVRRAIFAFGQILIDKTKSKNILLSSGALTSFTLRSPKDVTYLGLMLGMNENYCKDAVFNNGIKVIKHSEIRKNVNCGTISINSNDEQQSDKWLIKEFNIKRTLNEENIKTKKIKVK